MMLLTLLDDDLQLCVLGVSSAPPAPGVAPFDPDDDDDDEDEPR